MSTATIPRRCEPGAHERSLFDDTLGGEPTLAEVIAGVWEGLAVRGSSPCPVCGAVMEARYGAHTRHVDGRCTVCGATLS